MDISNILTYEQKQAIVTIIQHQCLRHSSREANYQDLNYAPYAGNRGEHSITLSVISGFLPTTKIPGIEITLQKYGLNDKMGQPVLTGNNCILHIYNSGCGFSSKPFLDCCKMNMNEPENHRKFACIVFKASNKGILKYIQLRIPDETGKFIITEQLYDNKIAKLNIA